MNRVSQISHIILSGGGIKGLCYLGILRYLYLENMIDNIKNVSGSSIGAYFTLLLALKMPIDLIENELSNIIVDINEKHIMDITKGKFANILNNLGFNTLDFMIEPVARFIKEKYDESDITFIEFVKKTGVNIYISTTNIATGQGKIFSAELTPQSSVLTAVMASMSVPFIFEPVIIDDGLYVDGMMSCDLPTEIFKNVNKKYVLAVILCQTAKNKADPEPDKQSYNFIEYTVRISQILISTVSSQSSNKYKNKSCEHILKIVDLPYDQAFKYKITDNDIQLELSQEDIDNLTLKGFIDMSKYMSARYKEYIIDNI